MGARTVPPIKVVVLNWRNYLGMGEQYVQRMREMVAKHLTIEHEFVVVTEDDIPEGRTGWFNKLHLLEMFDGEVLYLDLDLDINDSIDPIVEAARAEPDCIWARNDFSYPLPGHGGREATINSSVVYWRGKKDMSGAEALIPVTHGDQGIITQLFWPERIRLIDERLIDSYKYQRARGQGSAPIVVYHGNPKPHEIGLFG